VQWAGLIAPGATVLDVAAGRGRHSRFFADRGHAITALERKIFEKAIFPAVDPLSSTSRILDPQIVGEEHYAVARQVQAILSRGVNVLEGLDAVRGLGGSALQRLGGWLLAA